MNVITDQTCVYVHKHSVRWSYIRGSLFGFIMMRICSFMMSQTHCFNKALMGQAVDRHLLALKLQAIEEGLSVPRVFMDTAYGLATHWKLRTGQVTPPEHKHFFSSS